MVTATSIIVAFSVVVQGLTGNAMAEHHIASLVVLYFMHVRYESKLVSISVVTGIAWLGVLVMLILMDYMSRGWLRFPGKWRSPDRV